MPPFGCPRSSADYLDLEGNGLNVLKVMPESAIKFGSYEVAETLLWYSTKS